MGWLKRLFHLATSALSLRTEAITPQQVIKNAAKNGDHQTIAILLLPMDIINKIDFVRGFRPSLLSYVASSRLYTGDDQGTRETMGHLRCIKLLLPYEEFRQIGEAISVAAYTQTFCADTQKVVELWAIQQLLELRYRELKQSSAITPVAALIDANTTQGTTPTIPNESNDTQRLSEELMAIVGVGDHRTLQKFLLRMTLKQRNSVINGCHTHPILCAISSLHHLRTEHALQEKPYLQCVKILLRQQPDIFIIDAAGWQIKDRLNTCPKQSINELRMIDYALATYYRDLEKPARPATTVCQITSLNRSASTPHR
jgi:hypothetical protein